MRSSTMPVLRSHQSQSKLKAPRVVAGRTPPPLVHSCPVMPKCYELGESFDFQRDASSINESRSYTEYSGDQNADNLHFDKEKFMKLVLTEDWANIF